MLNNQPITKSSLEEMKIKRSGFTQNAFMESIWGKMIAIIVFIICAFSMTMVVDHRLTKDISYYLGILSSVSLLYFLFKVVISFFYKPTKSEPLDHKVSVIISNFNESIDSVHKTIDCLLKQDYPIHEIIFVDDGSDDESAYNEVLNMSKNMEIKKNNSIEKNCPTIITHRFAKNKGKRSAQAWAFQRSTGDILFLVDSDGYIFPDALSELLKPMRDSKVNSVVGHILPRNDKTNFITRLQDILYTGAFRIGRGAQSVTSSVLVCSGALSIHRREFVVKHLDIFLRGKIFGIETDAGDDRCLTMLSLAVGGKTKYQSTALCITDVPEKTGKFFKQQVRWSKSFFLYTVYSLKYAWKKPAMLFWLIGEGFMWLLFSISKLFSLFNGFSLPIHLIIIYSLAYLTIASFLHGVYYIFRNPLVFLLAPIFSLCHMFLLFPIRVYALLTLKKTNWGTR